MAFAESAADAPETCQTTSYACQAGTCYRVRARSSESWSNGYTSLSEMAHVLGTMASANLCRMPAPEPCQSTTYACQAGTCYRLRINGSHDWSNGIVSIEGLAEELSHLVGHQVCAARQPAPQCETTTYACQAGTCYRVRIDPGHSWSNGIVSLEELARTVRRLRRAGVCQ